MKEHFPNEVNTIKSKLGTRAKGTPAKRSLRTLDRRLRALETLGIIEREQRRGTRNALGSKQTSWFSTSHRKIDFSKVIHNGIVVDFDFMAAEDRLQGEVVADQMADEMADQKTDEMAAITSDLTSTSTSVLTSVLTREINPHGGMISFAEENTRGQEEDARRRAEEITLPEAAARPPVPAPARDYAIDWGSPPPRPEKINAGTLATWATALATYAADQHGEAPRLPDEKQVGWVLKKALRAGVYWETVADAVYSFWSNWSRSQHPQIDYPTRVFIRDFDRERQNVTSASDRAAHAHDRSFWE